jgi:hypothetical protein
MFRSVSRNISAFACVQYLVGLGKARVGRWLRDLAAHKYLYRVSAKTITKYDL